MTDRGAFNATGRRIEEAAVEKFRAVLRGRLLGADDDGYDEARKLWNGMFDRRPALIARCAGTADVISAVNFAGSPASTASLSTISSRLMWSSRTAAS